jgi:hypothetical protein
VFLISFRYAANPPSPLAAIGRCVESFGHVCTVHRRPGETNRDLDHDGGIPADVCGRAPKRESTSSSAVPRGHDGQHHHDRPPRFQKLDFPRYDGKTDPLIFTNRCESYFHQQRIMEEEKV